MGWQQEAVGLVSRHGVPVKSAVRLVLDAFLPGGPAVVELVARALDCVQPSGKSQLLVKESRLPEATAGDLNRVEDMLKVLADTLPALLEELVAPGRRPDQYRQVLERTLRTDDHCRTVLGRIDRLSRRFDRLEEHNRLFLSGRGYTGGVLREVLPLVRRLTSVLDVVEELRSTTATAAEFHKHLHAFQQAARAFGQGRIGEAKTALTGLVNARPHSAVGAAALAAVLAANHELTAAQESLGRAVRLRPQDLELAELHRRLMQLSTWALPAVPAGPQEGKRKAPLARLLEEPHRTLPTVRNAPKALPAAKGPPTPSKPKAPAPLPPRPIRANDLPPAARKAVETLKNKKPVPPPAPPGRTHESSSAPKKEAVPVPPSPPALPMAVPVRANDVPASLKKEPDLAQTVEVIPPVAQPMHALEIPLPGMWCSRPARQAQAKWKEVAITPAVVPLRPGETHRLSLFTYVPDAELAALAPLRNLPTLEELYLGNCRKITDAGLAHLAGFMSLQKLKLNGSQVTGVGLIYLRSLPRLRVLDLTQCEQVNDTGLAGLRDLTGLLELSLWECKQVTSQGLAHLAGLGNLKWLNLWDCENVSDAGLVHVGKLTNLQWLSLMGCQQLTDEGLAHLHKLARLRRLHLETCDKITRDGVFDLRMALPGCYISY